MEDRWGRGPTPGGDELDGLVYLSRRIGADPDLVQPGGGNSSIKCRIEEPFGGPVDGLMVKGSGSDLRTVERENFTRLALSRLAPLRDRSEMADEEMVELMGAAMIHPHRDRFPSLETPLHALLPYRVIVHTHDVATMSLTNLPGDAGRDLVKKLFPGELHFVPFFRPGFPLARAIREISTRIPAAAVGMVLAHHGLVVWGEDPEECYRHLLQVVEKAEQFLQERKKGARGRAGSGRSALPAEEIRRDRAEVLLPVLRGFLGKGERVILHCDSSDRTLEAVAADGLQERSRLGMATPDHVLRAGRLPLWLSIDFSGRREEWIETAREQLALQYKEYREYHERHAKPGQEPIPDWAKVLLVPGLGMVTAFIDKENALAANLCYHAVLKTIENAECLDRFHFLSEQEVFEFEHWPLERRKVEEKIQREKRGQLLFGRIALIIGAGSGIGEAAAIRFAEEGAHVIAADLDPARAGEVARQISERFPHRAISAGVDVRDEATISSLVRNTVLEFGGLDCLFYSAGLAPGFSSLTELRRSDLQTQLDVHYLGAMAAIREAARVMRRQQLGGSIICSVSKAALAPSRQAAAYGGSKAALQHALRTAALELGPDGIRVNTINADQVETPLFLRFAAARARSRGLSLEEQLEEYRKRNALGVSLIPPRAVAELAVLLASDKFRYTTGDILTIDGGLPDAFPR